jgi:hypothetical protein
VESHRGRAEGEERMTRDDIIRLAHQAGLFDDDQEPLPEYLEAFAKLVAAACPPCNNNCNQGRTCPAREYGVL